MVKKCTTSLGYGNMENFVLVPFCVLYIFHKLCMQHMYDQKKDELFRRILNELVIHYSIFTFPFCMTCSHVVTSVLLTCQRQTFSSMSSEVSFSQQSPDNCLVPIIVPSRLC